MEDYPMSSSVFGRPLRFKSVKELEKEIQAYFDSCFEYKWFDEVKRDPNTGEKLKDEKGEYIVEHIKRLVQVEPVSITGLAVALNTSRETLMNYEEKEDYFDAIKKAKDFIHSCIEKGMINGKINPTAAIFNLKNNFGWKDKTETELSTADNGFKITIGTIGAEVKPKEIEVKDIVKIPAKVEPAKPVEPVAPKVAPNATPVAPEVKTEQVEEVKPNEGNKPTINPEANASV